MTGLPVLSLNPAIDATALAARYAADGRVQIHELLAPAGAQALYELLRSRDDWVQVVNSGEKLFELTRAARAAMTAEQRAQLDTAVYAGARSGFQLRYETIRVPDDATTRLASPDPLATLANWLSSDPVITLLRTVTGTTEIDFADAQATAFAPGDLLTGHDDAVAGKRRHAAYVLGLTPQWRAEWGGLLLFHDDHEVHGGYVPEFNTLNLFRVPMRHSVTEVTRAAAHRRYSVTGWLRSR
ncbi:Proline 4-hydroxylase (includes Rps23 Pro-64 3,4-dihydroxylase Tpa1), contains SM-20 domain [Sphingomonas guangdongensis]|uniref:Proline 4-hydroxylase (Includes Rps23 Pro-64 3,4-dihydroxylase Tpa1), contains SM-20 domain n=1 Tax=Sphingomonas guangdongensis TaxID=1141890 RepID=A0A285R3C5_9SPHN|nr:2OG-Fe(II) oxygenase family protein [Sphingomonas guangdongensis]SOB86857.1 Proline 4-hydroxylase (includes Rps23 Pro-64 3,4-dihydroxylase Tpa1), contains SM-20 domain [Sphingomonas guangdongensis]